LTATSLYIYICVKDFGMANIKKKYFEMVYFAVPHDRNKCRWCCIAGVGQWKIYICCCENVMRGIRKSQNASWCFHSSQGENNFKYSSRFSSYPAVHTLRLCHKNQSPLLLYILL